MALFITFEGGEGSGKSLQARSLYKKLTDLAMPAVLTHEPGGTPFGKQVSRMLKWTRNIDISPLAELMLFNASRSQLVSRVIRPNLIDGKTVICDRYTDSTTAYQSYGRGLDLDMVKVVNNAATRGLVPDLTVLMYISAEDGLARKGSSKLDRFEHEDISFHHRVNDGYIRLAAENPERWLTVDATQGKDKIARIIWERVRLMLSGKE